LLQTPTDEDLEALCKLLLTGVGRLLDHDKAKGWMDQYIEKLLEFSRQQSLFSPRIRFLIQDVVAARRSKWPKPRDTRQTAAPSTIKSTYDPGTVGTYSAPTAAY
jgi:translation initiation factor 4G